MRYLATVCVLCAALDGARVWCAADEPPPPYGSHAQLRVYVDGSGEERPIKTPAEWGPRRRHILAGMQQAMGSLPDRRDMPPFDMRVTDEVSENGVRRQEISFASGDGDRVSAYLYLPIRASVERLPAVLALHQTAAIGKGDPAGLGSPKSRPYATELAERGYAVLAPDYPSFGDSKDYDFAHDRYESGTMKGIFNRIAPSTCSRPAVTSIPSGSA